MKNGSINRGPVIGAAVAAGFLMLVLGVAYRVLAARLAGGVSATPISSAELQRLPLQIGGWTGLEAPLDEAIVAATDTDAHLSRRYSRHSASESVWLYIASGVNARDLMPHRPEVCYTGQGWTLIDRQFVELPLDNETTLPCNCFRFSRGALNTKEVVVLDYYIVDRHGAAPGPFAMWPRCKWSPRLWPVSRRIQQAEQPGPLLPSQLC